MVTGRLTVGAGELGLCGGKGALRCLVGCYYTIPVGVSGRATLARTAALRRMPPAAAGRQACFACIRAHQPLCRPSLTHLRPPPRTHAGVPPEQVAIGQWQPGQTFGQFAEATFSKYYGQAA